MSTADRKYFTVEEANRTLPLVSAIVRDIVDLYNDVHERRERLARVRHRPGSSQSGESTPYSEELEQIERELDTDIGRLKSFTDELQRLGVELKDPVSGLIDYYSKMDGRDVSPGANPCSRIPFRAMPQTNNRNPGSSKIAES